MGDPRRGRWTNEVSPGAPSTPSSPIEALRDGPHMSAAFVDRNGWINLDPNMLTSHDQSSSLVHENITRSKMFSFNG